MSATTIIGLTAGVALDLPRSDWPIPPGAGDGFRWPAPRTTRDGMYWPAPRVRTEKAAAAADAAVIARGSLVYYLQVRETDGQAPVKIGHSTNLNARIKGLQRAWGRLDLLAREPGGHATEELRHWQFMPCRIPAMPLPGGSEFFELTRTLDNHLAWLLDVQHGYPQQRNYSVPGMGA